MCAAVERADYRPRDEVQFEAMVRHFRGAILPDEIAWDLDLFVGDLGFDPTDAQAAAQLVADEKGWRP